MLKKKYILPKKVKIRENFQISNQLFIVKFQSNFLGYARFGIILSKKLSSKAVLRNKMERQIKAFLRNYLHLSYDFLIIPRRLTTSFKEIELYLKDIFDKIK